MIESIKNLKKVELHLHLDGSLFFDTVSDVTGRNIEDLKNEMIAYDKCNNLSEYLEKFDLPISIMQSREVLFRVSRDLVNYLERENVIYAEVRFSPIFHVNGGLSYDEVVEAVIEGLNSNKKVKTNIILSMMRGIDKETNIKVIDVASRYLGRGVCAIDLAGAEDKYLLGDYEDLFAIAKSKNIPFTIHAGENGGYEEVKKAVLIGAKRIGHGIHAINDDETINLLKEKNVLLEICPTSNEQTNAVLKYEDNPIYNFYKMGVNVSINTDNVTVSNVSLSEEYMKLYNTFNFDVEDFKNINKMSINAAFISDLEREELLREL